MTELPPNESKSIIRDHSGNPDQEQEYKQTETASQFQGQQDSQHTQPEVNQKDTTKNPNIKPMTRGEWLMVVFTAVIAVSTIAYSIIAYRQWDVMSRQLEEIRGSSADTRTMAKAAQDAAAAANKNIEVVQENIRLEQRAWVGVVQVEASGSIEPKSKIQFSATLTNSGNTPARNFIGFITARLLQRVQPFVATYPKLPTSPSVTVIHPGMKIALKLSSMEFTQTEIDSLKTGTHILRIYGKFSYEDIFERPWRGTFCAYLDQELRAIHFCDLYNEAE